ncbi:MAG: hypothetical protein ACYC3X_18475 [Pirellulaceae bacterium]
MTTARFSVSHVRLSTDESFPSKSHAMLEEPRASQPVAVLGHRVSQEPIT